MSAPAPVPASSDLGHAIDWLRFNAVEEMADLAASYWRSIAEAAARNERAVLNIHCRQVAAVTREAFALVKQIEALDNMESAA